MLNSMFQIFFYQFQPCCFINNKKTTNDFIYSDNNDLFLHEINYTPITLYNISKTNFYDDTLSFLGIIFSLIGIYYFCTNMFQGVKN
tara:strand:+ start:7054 stop:7314 length:261 start_codon:yes stop_codon:yes gene_type:complete